MCFTIVRLCGPLDGVYGKITRICDEFFFSFSHPRGSHFERVPKNSQMFTVQVPNNLS